MMKARAIKRLAAACGATLFAWLLISAILPLAGAGMDTTVVFRHAAATDEPNQFTPEEGAVLMGAWRVVVDARATSYLRSFHAAIVAITPSWSLPSAATVDRNYGTGQLNSDEITIGWDTRALTPYNGLYRIEASAVSELNNREDAFVSNLKVNNPPEIPASLDADLRQGVPALEWRPNPEPDITGYGIYRSQDGKPFSKIATVGTTSFQDSDAPEGVPLRYRVTAVRTSPLSSSGIESVQTTSTYPITILPPEAAEHTSLISESAAVQEQAPVVQTEIVVGARRDVGYSSYLPYEATVPETQAAPIMTAESVPEPVFKTVREVITQPVSKLPYLAAAAVLLIAALHAANLARRIMSSA